MVSATFIALAALITLGLLAYALRPMWRARPTSGLALVAVLTCATAALYLLVGTPAALDAARRTPDDPIATAVAQLETTMRAKPDADGLRLLARTYASQDRTNDARDTLARAVPLAPDNADLLAEAAEARAKASSTRMFDAQAIAWLERALRITPNHQRSRWFLGIARRQQQRHAEAAATWLPLLSQVDARTAASLRTQINAARKDAGLPALTSADLPAAKPGLVVNVRLDPALAGQVTPDSRVFVLARIAGSAMPVAVETIAVDSLPTTVTLDDGDSPMPTRTLSQAGRVEVLARISLRGVANAAPGDLASLERTTQATSVEPIELVIDRVVK